MDPKTGDILAMAGYPNYNLNEPYKPSTDEMKEVWDSLSDSDKTKQMQAMWRNKAVTDTYEPGSTFKLYTASAALEEGITDTDKEGEFVFGPLCPGKEYALQIWVNDTKKIKICAKCHHEGKCLKGDKCDKCDCFINEKHEPCKKCDKKDGFLKEEDLVFKYAL